MNRFPKAAVVLALLGVGLLVVLTIVPRLGADEAPEAEIRASLATVARFMQAGRQQDVATATMLFTTAARQNAGAESTLTSLFAQQRDVFATFVSLEQETYGSTVNRDLWRHSVLLEGTITGTGSVANSFRAELREEEGLWRLVTFMIQ